MIIIPKGTKVRVLDTRNIREKWNRPEAIGYEFVTDEDLYEDRCITCPDNKYHTNYEPEDLLVLKKPEEIINTYSIF